MSNRLVGNWLRGYMQYTDELEAPDNYHIWCGLSAIASVTRRRTWTDQGAYILYPNMYVALVGPPGRTGKSTAIRMARRLAKEVPGIIFGPDACSREQLIRSMAESKIDNQCCVTLHSSEFSSILDTSGLLMIQFLTDIYDCDYMNPKGWRYETKTSGKDNIVNPCLNILAGTTPSYIADSMPDNVTGHGFTSRTIFVYGMRERKINPRPKAPDKDLVQALIEDLNHIASLGGQFEFTKEGWECYDRHYHDLYKEEPTDHRIEGYHWRKRAHILKVAMVLSLAERDDLRLDPLVIDAAVQILHDLEKDMSRTFSAVGKYSLAADLERIGSQVIAAGGLPTEEIRRRNYFVGDRVAVDGIISMLCGMGVISLVIRDKKEWAVPAGGGLPWS